MATLDPSAGLIPLNPRGADQGPREGKGRRGIVIDKRKEATGRELGSRQRHLQGSEVKHVIENGLVMCFCGVDPCSSLFQPGTATPANHDLCLVPGFRPVFHIPAIPHKPQGGGGPSQSRPVIDDDCILHPYSAGWLVPNFHFPSPSPTKTVNMCTVDCGFETRNNINRIK